MPVYASTPGFNEQRRYPTALLLIVGGHAALIAAVMTAKMVIPIVVKESPLVLTPIAIPPDPPPPIDVPKPPLDLPQPPISKIDQIKPVIQPLVGPGPTYTDPVVPIVPATSTTVGTGLTPSIPAIAPDPVRVGPRFVTPADDVKPPYPDEKRRLDEEATLRLKISIDERGRVVGVEPVGKVDRAFFESARRHLIAHWRYKPATEDGRAVPSSTVITLRFELEA